MLTWISLAAVIVVAFLAWNLYNRFGADRIAELIEGRRATSRMVSRGELVEGNMHLNVALAVTQSAFHYESPDMQAFLDLERVREVEYDTELATGQVIVNGTVLRLRSSSQIFEFVLPKEVAERWRVMLPARGIAVTPPLAAQPVAT